VTRRRSEANSASKGWDGDENDKAKRRRAGTNDRTDGVEPTPLRAAFFSRGGRDAARRRGGRGVRNERDAMTRRRRDQTIGNRLKQIDPATTRELIDGAHGVMMS